ncbi:2-dehydropantoate 2-reductase [Xylaria bambusicola]|uniref:2-dehydropantoate 2-reductase n=1 Tax=Xylaria bambusicola TaxID=326684 RepID=UPI00200806C2|nr:2-dehydropantoate 2-reductase [Xylaria bambusicola]KAI0506035.1 2-dehydropantoate 2-reductase [Xylaria bambusicola]
MAAPVRIDILLYGLGAVGSFYAFILSRNKNVRLTVVARSNYDAVKASGLSITSENHGEHKVTPYKVVKTPAEAGSTFDYVVCAHKAIDQASVPRQLIPAVDERETTIVIIQNGVGNEEPFHEAFPGATILSCVTWVGANQPQPGIVKHTKSEDMQIGLFRNTSLEESLERERLNIFTTLLANGNTVFQVVPDIQVQRWEKVVWNAAWNSLTTLTMLDTHNWLKSSPEATPLTQRLMREVIDVANKCNVPLEYSLADRLINKILGMHTIGSSMQVDAKNGRPMEVEVILGYPVRKGKELGVSIPTLETIYVILTGMNRRFLGLATL